MTYLHDFDTSRSLTATVIETHRITPEDVPEVRNIRLAITHPGFNYHEGQNVGVIVPGPHKFGHEKHFRLYTIANTPDQTESGDVEIELCVRRCFYIDEVSGEGHPGIASNYLCDIKSGAEVSLTGPYGDAFAIPDDPASNLLMIGTGTGIAPFRAFIQHIYEKQPDWQGELRLFYGARTGMETLYQNDLKNDLDEYYDQKTFKAFAGLSHRPWMQSEENGLHDVLLENAHDIWEFMQNPKTHVYLAGLPKTEHDFEDAMSDAAGSSARWRWTREEMKEQHRWSELIYS